jgi:hypothetical protein
MYIYPNELLRKVRLEMPKAKVMKTKAAESNAEDCRQDAQKSQKRILVFALFVLLGGHSLRSNFPGHLGSRQSKQSN